MGREFAFFSWWIGVLGGVNFSDSAVIQGFIFSDLVVRFGCGISIR
jgi:hypothetical protein